MLPTDRQNAEQEYMASLFMKEEWIIEKMNGKCCLASNKNEYLFC